MKLIIVFLGSWAIYLFLWLFSHRDLMYEKDFFFFNVPRRIKEVIFLVNIPQGRIPLVVILFQMAFFLPIVIYSFVFLTAPIGYLIIGKAIGYPVILIMEYTRILFSSILLITAIYFFVCAIFAPKRKW